MHVNRRKAQSGLTLIKTIITIAVVTTFVVVLTVSFAVYMPIHRLRSVADVLDIQFQKARTEAIYRKVPVAIRFFTTEPGGIQKFGPIIWADKNYDAANRLHPLLEAGEEVLFRMPVTALQNSFWEFADYPGIRFDRSQAGFDGVGDGVSFAGNAFVLDSLGQSNQEGAVFLMNARGEKRKVIVMTNGTVKIMLTEN